MGNSRRSGIEPRERRGRLAMISVMGACLAAGNAAATAADDSLDRAMLDQAPGIIRYLKEHGFRNVGVLKFRVKKGDAPASDRVGPLNLNLAGRLEVALVLANDLKAPLGIIRDADAVAATIPGANHMDRPGRQALFRARYPLAWGDDEVEPDAFLTGVAVVSPDRKQMTVAILAFDKAGEALDRVAQFTASTDAPTLAEAGESFLVRSAFAPDRAEAAHAQAIASAARVGAAPAATPLRDPAAPVALEIRYDGRPIPLEIRDGKAVVPEPKEGQEVAFAIRKVDATADRYGVVLLVNGVNTLYKDRAAPLDAAKWVLGPEHRQSVVRGYQTGAGTAEAFRVLAPEASRTNAVRYGPAAGTVTLVVFPEQQARDTPPPLDDEGEDLAAMARGALPAERPRSLAALRFRLREGGGDRGTRGLIVEGETIGAKTRTVEFRAAPTPVMSATITYYKP